MDHRFQCRILECRGIATIFVQLLHIGHYGIQTASIPDPPKAADQLALYFDIPLGLRLEIGDDPAQLRKVGGREQDMTERFAGDMPLDGVLAVIAFEEKR